MRLIYQNAHSVIIWLGPGKFWTKHLFAQMSSLDQRVIKRPRPHTLATWKDEWEQMSIQPHVYNVPFGLGEALQNLLDRDWFERVWTIQEAAMARSARVACGQDQIHSRTFTMMPELLNVVPTAEQQARLDIMPGTRRETSWFSRQQDTNFGTLLKRFRSSKATIPHDKIYALMGICKKAYSSVTFRPDYTIPPMAAVKNVFHFLLKESGEAEDWLIGYYPEQTPNWEVSEFFKALEDFPFHIYTWALRNRQISLVRRILSAEKAKGSNGGFERLAIIPGGMAIAVQNKDLALIDMLLELPNIDPLVEGHRHLDFNDYSGHAGMSKALLSQAASEGYSKRVEFFLKLGTNIETRWFSKNRTPLWLAAGRGHLECVELLLSHGANIEAKAENGGTPLWNAADTGHSNCIELLFRYGANIEAKAGYGITPLWTAAHGGHSNCVDLLLRCGSNIEAMADCGITPLWAAAHEGRFNCVELLLNHRADIEAKKISNNATPLWVAAERGHMEFVELLLHYGAFTQAKDWDSGMTPLQAASRGGHTKCAELLRSWPQNRRENTEFELK